MELYEGRYFNQMIDVFREGLIQYPQSYILYESYIHCLMCKNQDDRGLMVFDRAVNNLKLEALPLWKRMLMYIQVRGSRMVMSSTLGLRINSLLVT